jgi:MoxR-like ATPase
MKLTDNNNVQTLVEKIKFDNEQEVLSQEFELISSKELFRLDEPLKGMEMIPVPKQRHHLSPEPTNHVFEPNLLRRMLIAKQDKDPIMLFGDKGCGKSSDVVEICAALSQPLLAITCTAGVLDEHLFGRLDFDGEKVTSVDGIVTYGIRKGYNILMDEIGALRPAVAIGMNDVCEKGDLITLKHMGFNPDVPPEQLIGRQVLVRHRSSQIWGTDNNGGKMVRNPRFVGVSTMNDALRSRFTYFKKNYLPKELEMKILVETAKNHRNASQMNEKALDCMVDFANRMRACQEKGECIGGFSTRELKRWVNKYLSYGDIDEALCDASYAGMEETDQALTKHLFEETFTRSFVLTPELSYSAASQFGSGRVSNAA